jgi:hypothetical protein
MSDKTSRGELIRKLKAAVPKAEDELAVRIFVDTFAEGAISQDYLAETMQVLESAYRRDLEVSELPSERQVFESEIVKAQRVLDILKTA